MTLFSTEINSSTTLKISEEKLFHKSQLELGNKVIQLVERYLDLGDAIINEDISKAQESIRIFNGLLLEHRSWGEGERYTNLAMISHQAVYINEIDMFIENYIDLSDAIIKEIEMFPTNFFNKKGVSFCTQPHNDGVIKWIQRGECKTKIKGL